MSLIEILQILRRRWYMLAIAAVLGFGAGYLTAPGAGTRTPHYEATTTLITNPTLTPSETEAAPNLNTAALLVTADAVPRRVATEMGIPVEAVTANVVAEPNVDVSSLAITATDRNASRAQQRSQLLAEALVGEFAESQLATYNDARSAAERDVRELTAKLEDLEAEVQETSVDGVPTDSAAVAARNAAQTDLQLANSALSQIRTAGQPQPSLMIVKRDAANEVAPDGIRPPDSRVLRGLLLGFVGLLLGAAAAMALDRADTRIRSRDDLEDALGLPVVAEIPSLPARLRSKHSLRAIHDPASSFMEAHRSLKTALTLDGTGPGALAMNRGRVVLIASASASEGKSTTAAHLAAALAEVGRSVLLVSADFRRPRVHSFYDVAIKPGLSEMLSTPSTSLKEVVVTTHLPGVRMLASGAPLENPSPLIETVSELLAAARQVFDYVIVDTAPLLVASDALGLIPVASWSRAVARSRRLPAMLPLLPRSRPF